MCPVIDVAEEPGLELVAAKELPLDLDTPETEVVAVEEPIQQNNPDKAQVELHGVCY